MFSSQPAKVTNNAPANSYGVGVRLGYMGHLSRYLSVGASYQSKIKMGKLENFAGPVRRTGRLRHPVQLGRRASRSGRPRAWTSPSTCSASEYSEVKSVGNPMLPNLQTARLGDDNGAGFGWKDMTTVKIGVQYRIAPAPGRARRLLVRRSSRFPSPRCCSTSSRPASSNST